MCEQPNKQKEKRYKRAGLMEEVPLRKVSIGKKKKTHPSYRPQNDAFEFGPQNLAEL